MTRNERLQLIRIHKDKSADQLARLLRVSLRTIQRDMRELRPDIPTDAPMRGDATENLRETQRVLREGLKTLTPGSEQFRKSIATIADIETKIHKVEQAKPIAERQDVWEYIAVLDSRSGKVSCLKLADAPESVRSRLENVDDEDAVNERSVRQRLASEAGERYAASQAADGVSPYERKLRYDEWISAQNAEQN